MNPESVIYYYVEGRTGSGTWLRFDKTPDEQAALKSFSDWMIARPDLPFRLRKETTTSEIMMEVQR